MHGTWWFAKAAPIEGIAGESRYLTITYRGAGHYELHHSPSTERYPFILTSASQD